MSDTKLPGLSNKKESELQAIYVAELGKPIPEELTTVASLKEAIQAHRDGAIVGTEEERTTDGEPGIQEPGQTVPPAASAAPKVDTVLTVHPELGEREWSAESWKLLGPDKSGWQVKVTKPADLQ